jgi:hypothetical protein
MSIFRMMTNLLDQAQDIWSLPGERRFVWHRLSECLFLPGFCGSTWMQLQVPKPTTAVIPSVQPKKIQNEISKITSNISTP